MPPGPCEHLTSSGSPTLPARPSLDLLLVVIVGTRVVGNVLVTLSLKYNTVGVRPQVGSLDPVWLRMLASYEQMLRKPVRCALTPTKESRIPLPRKSGLTHTPPGAM